MEKVTALTDHLSLMFRLETAGLPEIMLDLARDHQDSALIELSPPFNFHDPLTIPLRSDMVHSILSGRQSAGFERPDLDDPFAEIWGDGMLLSEGEQWRERRKAASPEMRRERVKGFLPAIDGVVQRCIKRAASPDGCIEDVKRLMDRVSLEVLDELYLDGLLDVYDFEQLRADFTLIERYNRYNRMGVVLPRSVPGTIGSRFESIKKRIFTNARTLIKRHGGDGLIGKLQDCTDDEGITDEVVTMIAAGYRTTAAMMTWGAYLLATHDKSERYLSSMADSKQPDELLDNDYLNAFINEVMRLYPAAWQVQREAAQDVTIKDTTIPEGRDVMVSPLLIHRSPYHWKTPDDFRPERRFIKGDARKRKAYLPFGRGRHTCIGQHLARLEAKLIFLRLAERGPISAPTNKPGMTGAVEINPDRPIRLALDDCGDAMTVRSPESSAESSSGCPFH